MLKTVKCRVPLILSLLLVITLSSTSCVAEDIAVPVATTGPTLSPQGQPISITTATADTSHELAPTATATAIPDPSPISLTPTAISTPIPLPAAERLVWDFKIAFTTLQKRDDTFISELWIIELPEQEPRQLLDFRSAATLSENRVSWSRDGHYVAYGHHTADNKVAVSIVDVRNSLVQQLGFSFPIDPFDTGNSSGINLSHDSWSLDDRWVQVTLSYFKPDSNFPVEQEIFISTVDGQVIELDEQIEFVAWSKTVPDQFLCILHPDSEIEYPTVHISQISLSEPVFSFKDLEEHGPGIRFDISWAPDSMIALSTSYDVATGLTRLLWLDFGTGTWSLLPYQPRGRAAPFLWSSNNRWIVFWHNGIFYLWPIYEINRPSSQLSGQTEQVTSILGWLPDENWLIYQLGDILYAVDPELPDNTFEVLDFDSLKVTSEQRLQASIWIPNLP